MDQIHLVTVDVRPWNLFDGFVHAAQGLSENTISSLVRRPRNNGCVSRQ